MASTKITGYSAFSQIDPATDILVGVDISDTSMNASGTDKKLTSDFMKYAGMTYIQGLQLQYNSATVLRVLAGTCGVNGKMISFSQTDYTSGSTMKTIANGTVTLASNKCYNVFISDAGVIGINLNDSTGDSAPPSFSTTYDYWASASTGVAWRRIGKFWTDGSGNILQFTFTGRGRQRRMWLTDHDAVVAINGVTADGSYHAVTITPYFSSDDDFTGVWGLTTTAGGTILELSVDGGTNSIHRMAFTSSTAGNLGSSGTAWLPYTGTLHYKGANTTVVYVALEGADFYV